MATRSLSIDPSDAPEMRQLLDSCRGDGVTYTLRLPAWWNFIGVARFTISGPPGVLARVEREVESLRDELWGERQI